MCVFVSVCFCCQSGEEASVRLLKWQLKSCDSMWSLKFVRLALKAFMPNDGDVMDVILLYCTVLVQNH